MQARPASLQRCTKLSGNQADGSNTPPAHRRFCLYDERRQHRIRRFAILISDRLLCLHCTNCIVGVLQLQNFYYGEGVNIGIKHAPFHIVVVERNPSILLSSPARQARSNRLPFFHPRRKINQNAFRRLLPCQLHQGARRRHHLSRGLLQATKHHFASRVFRAGPVLWPADHST